MSDANPDEMMNKWNIATLGGGGGRISFDKKQQRFRHAYVRLRDYSGYVHVCTHITAQGTITN